jgi:hypothetical protein
VEHDLVGSSLLSGLGEAEKQNIALLLDRLDGRFTHQINLLRTQISGRMGTQEAGSKNREERLKKLENCPCAVHRDPAHTCVVLDTHATLARIEAKVDAKIDAKVNPIKLRLAYILGGFGVLVFLIEIAARLLPLCWR